MAVIYAKVARLGKFSKPFQSYTRRDNGKVEALGGLSYSHMTKRLLETRYVSGTPQTYFSSCNDDEFLVGFIF